MSTPFRLLIADRRPIATYGFEAAFEQAPDLVVRARCHAVLEIPTVIGSGSMIDAVIVDADMFDCDPARAVEALRELDPDIAILLLITRVDPLLLEALAHARVSCVSVFGAVHEIVAALHALLNEQTLLPPEVQRALTVALRQPAPPLSALLTSREQQVLELAATGLTICQIAARLYISHSTAKTHLLRCYEKLGAPNRSAAVATAIARGMLRTTAATT